MGDPLSKRIRDFGRPVPQKPSSKISTPPPPVSGVRGSSRRTKRKTVTRTTPVTPKESEPGVVTSKDVKADVYRSALPVLRKGYEQYKSIDPSAKYKLESGEIISGKELQSRYREQLYSGM